MRTFFLAAFALATVMHQSAAAQTNLAVRYSRFQQDYLYASNGVMTGYSMPWEGTAAIDINSCTAFIPCQTLHYANLIAQPGSTIHVSDPASFTWVEGYPNYGRGPLTITKPVTIDFSGTLEPCPFPITINVGPADLVILRGLKFANFTGTPITVVNGSVRIEDVKISGASANGISVQSGKVIVSNSTIDSAGYGIYSFGPAALTLDNVQLSNSTQAGLLSTALTGYSTVMVRNSNFTGNNTAISSFTNGSVAVENSVLAMNNTAVTAQAGTVRLSAATIIDNGIALNATQGGSIVSFVNNRIYGNQNNGAPTVSVYQK